MKYMIVSSLLTVVLLSCPVHAQSVTPSFAGGGPGISGGGRSTGSITVSRGSRGRPGHPGTCAGGNCFGTRGHRNRYRGDSYGYGYSPYGYYPYVDDISPYWELDDQQEPQSEPPTPSPAAMRSSEPRSAPAPAPAPDAKLVEVPQAFAAKGKRASNAEPTPTAVFVLTGGQRLEATRYILTSDALQVQVDGARRSIPLSALNLDATIAANRERGIDLQPPQNRAQVTLSF